MAEGYEADLKGENAKDFPIIPKITEEALIEINNNKILRGAFLQNGFKEKDLSTLILSVDKLKKINDHKNMELCALDFTFH